MTFYLKFNDIQLENVKHYKYLYIIINDKLNFKLHAN